jgi:hypothetical protein
MRTLAAHRGHVAGMKAAGDRSRVGRFAHDRVQAAHQSTLIRFQSITESFCAETLLDAAERLGTPAKSVTAATIWEEAAVAGTRTWEDQQRSYKNWLQVSLDWSVIKTMADVRNAVAHGLGTLTRRQLQSEQAVTNRIRGLGIPVVARVVILSDPALRGLAVKSRDFIYILDDAVQTRVRTP